MFWKRKPAGPKAAAGSGDRELDARAAALAARQERIAQLELDLLNSQTELAAFNAEIEQRLGALQRRLETLETELAEARRQASRRALWGERASSPEVPEDVITQYNRLWGREARSAPSSPAPMPAAAAVNEAELKTLYRALAKRFHPDLATDPSEKQRRAEIMARVNDAYSAQDLAALRQLANEHPEPPPPPAPKTRDQVLAEMQAEIERLDDLALRLEQQLDDLAKSPAVQLKLEALWAHRAGGDLLADMGRQLQAEIARTENELATLR